MVEPSLLRAQLLVVRLQIRLFLQLKHHHSLQLCELFDVVFEVIYFLKHQVLRCHPSQVFLSFLGQQHHHQAYELAFSEPLE